jgi:hypothetical protein
MSVTRLVEPDFAAIYKGFISGLAYTTVRHIDVIGQVQDHPRLPGILWRTL